jgi:hypothetical protein
MMPESLNISKNKTKARPNKIENKQPACLRFCLDTKLSRTASARCALLFDFAVKTKNILAADDWLEAHFQAL